MLPPAGHTGYAPVQTIAAGHQLTYLKSDPINEKSTLFTPGKIRENINTNTECPTQSQPLYLDRRDREDRRDRGDRSDRGNRRDREDGRQWRRGYSGDGRPGRQEREQ